MTDKERLRKHLGQAVCASLMAFSLTGLSAPDYQNIAFHPVPLTSDAVSPLASFMPASVNGHLPARLDNALQASAIAQYQAAIHEAEMTLGTFDESIAQQAESLGDLLAQTGDTSGALAAYEKALHIQRVNNGLHSAAQVGVLHKMITTQTDAGHLDHAHSLHESLLYLQKRLHRPGDQGYIAAILEWADWNVDYLLKANTPVTGSYSNFGPTTLNTLLVTAQENYIDAIDLIRASEAITPVQKRRLVHAEKKLAAINYIANSKTSLAGTSSSSGFSDNDSFGDENRRASQAEMAYFFNGSNALKRAIAYSLESPQPDYLSIAEQMMTLGDWYLLFDRRAAALSVYEDAYEVLDAVQASDDDISRIMTPGMPVTAPDVAGNNSTPTYHGYIDVEFQVSKFGIASSPEVIATSEQDVSPVTRALIRKIRQEKFRPSFTDGSATSSENVKLRYYYSYN